MGEGNALVLVELPAEPQEAEATLMMPTVMGNITAQHIAFM